jgi:hypothetical protein
MLRFYFHEFGVYTMIHLTSVHLQSSNADAERFCDHTVCVITAAFCSVFYKLKSQMCQRYRTTIL